MTPSTRADGQDLDEDIARAWIARARRHNATIDSIALAPNIFFVETAALKQQPWGGVLIFWPMRSAI